MARVKITVWTTTVGEVSIDAQFNEDASSPTPGAPLTIAPAVREAVMEAAFAAVAAHGKEG